MDSCLRGVAVFWEPKMFKQGVARMTMLEKGAGLQWRPLVYFDLPTRFGSSSESSLLSVC